MSGLTTVLSLFQRRRWHVVVVVLGVLGTSGVKAEASPIKQYQVSARANANLRTWSSFLSGGAQLWARRAAPTITAAVRVAMAQALGSANARLSPWVQYLVWRQGLNPARFNRWHPQMVPYLNNLPPIKNVCPCTPPKSPQQTNKPPTKPNPTPGGLIPPTVPEPNTLLLSLGLIGSGLFWRYHAGRSSLRPVDRA